MITRSLLLFALLFGSSVQHNPAVELASAEKLFSETSVKEGVKQSFLKFFADECIVFNPEAVNGKELYAKRKQNSAVLSWHPVFVETAASGDYGISTGPWEYAKGKDQAPAAFGYFFSVWKKQMDGTWKVVLDCGIDIPKAKLKNEPEDFHILPTPKGKPLYPESAQAELQKVEKNFIQSYRLNGAANAYKNYIAENGRVYREGTFPAINKNESLDMLRRDSVQTEFIPLETQISFANDLGYTYGYAITTQHDSSSYVRVWRKEKKNWKIAVDILKPFNR
jgi:ketosteroid isomerase-like protein